VILGLLLGCHPHPSCPEGETRRDGRCFPYEAGDPVYSSGWRPAPGLAWQVQYTGTLDRSLEVDAWNVDLFDTSDADIELLQANGRRVVCYFSAGSFEEWRPDADRFPSWALGRPLDGWEGEWWLDITSSVVVEIMRDRILYAGERGCDAVDADNVNGWTNDTGFALTATMQLDFNRFLADTAHRNGLSVFLKNDVEQLDALEPWFDGAVNEECITFDECEPYAVFTDAEKAVVHLEYVDDWADAEGRATEICGRGPRLDTLIKQWELGPERLACPPDPS